MTVLMQKAYITGLAAPPRMKVGGVTVKMHTNPSALCSLVSRQVESLSSINIHRMLSGR